MPIYQTASYVFDNADHAAKLFGLEEGGNIYTRITNPTNAVFEERIAALEGGYWRACGFIGARGTAGCHKLLLPKQGIISFLQVIYTEAHTISLRLHSLSSVIKVKLIDSNDAADFEPLIDEKTKAIYIETIGNPKLNIPDLESFARLAHKNNIPLIVDNTFGAGGVYL